MKKNKLSMFFVALALTLTVYYFTIPNINTTNVEPNTTVSTEYDGFKTRREEIILERDELLFQLDLIIIDDSTSLDSKKLALQTMAEISALTNKEYEVEGIIEDMGYKDVLIYVDEELINVSIIADEFSNEEFVEIATNVKLEFGEMYDVSIEIINDIF